MTGKWETLDNSESVEISESSEKIEFAGETLEVVSNNAKLTTNN